MARTSRRLLHVHNEHSSSPQGSTMRVATRFPDKQPNPSPTQPQAQKPDGQPLRATLLNELGLQPNTNWAWQWEGKSNSGRGSGSNFLVHPHRERPLLHSLRHGLEKASLLQHCCKQVPTHVHTNDVKMIHLAHPFFKQKKFLASLQKVALLCGACSAICHFRIVKTYKWSVGAFHCKRMASAYQSARKGHVLHTFCHTQEVRLSCSPDNRRIAQRYTCNHISDHKTTSTDLWIVAHYRHQKNCVWGARTKVSRLDRRSL